MIKKLREKSGETLVEVLASMFIFLILFGILQGAVSYSHASMQKNKQIREENTQIIQGLASAQKVDGESKTLSFIATTSEMDKKGSVILPQFQSLFDQMDSLPVPTTILIACSNFITQRWYVALMVVFAIVVVVKLIVGIPGVRRTLDRGKVRMPVFGNLFKVIYTARFARTLSSLYSSGMPIATAIATAGNTIGNRYIEEQFEEVVTQVRSGVPLSQALHSVDGFQKKLASTVQIGEESGRLDLMLDSIASSLEDEAEQATKRIVTLLEPILIVFMAVIVGFIMIAVMLPIYQSYASIENS